MPNSAAHETATLAFEIGTEEIPAFDLERATNQLSELVPAALDEVRIPHSETRIYSTPRRLIAIVSEVGRETEALVETFRGPSVKIAFDDEGNPTKAAMGFARGKGVEISDLERRREGDTEYVFASRQISARPSAELLPEVLRGVIEGITWPKSCHWGTTRDLFSRPVRWLVAMLGEEIIPVEFAGLTAGNATRGHRVLAPGPFTVATADDLIATVEAASVVTTAVERESIIRSGVAAIEDASGLVSVLPDKTLREVINLTEHPTVLEGTFDEAFLQVPEEIIVDAMLMHQRYFPLYHKNGKLSHHFIVVSNGDPAHAATIIEGNERVVAARLYDARFFYEADLKHPLEHYVDALDGVVFQESLGTMRDKTNRAVSLAEHVVQAADLAADVAEDALRAAYLSKADLVTNAVIEFTSVQGVMGSYYAVASGENERVARAVAEHYRPRFSGDDVPTDAVGQVVAFADKLDTICGLFAVGQVPTGKADPFALRRAALGIISILQAGLDVKLLPAIDAALSVVQQAGIDFDLAKVRESVVEFFVTRVRVLLRDEGAGADAIDAVLATNEREPMEIIKRVRALERARQSEPEQMRDLALAFARANNLRDPKLGEAYDRSLFGEPETRLANAIDEAHEAVQAALSAGNYETALGELSRLRVPVDEFFTQVMIMDENPAIRENRLKLLNSFVNVFTGVADFGLMASK